jgi:hypothetical protein
MSVQAADPLTATIVDSGSTNRAGFRIEVDRSGSAEFTATRRRSGIPDDQVAPIRKTLAEDTVKRFYADLEAAKPLSSLPAAHCMKSVSFGTTRRIVLGQDQTPDLTCGDAGNESMRALIRDVNEIVDLMRGN